MSRLTTTRTVRQAEVLYAVGALCLLTQGPVYQLWSRSAEYQRFVALPTIGHAHFATFVAIQIPALALLVRRLSGDFLRQRRGQFLVAFHLWLGLTVMWSTLARHSLPEFVSLVLTTSVGLYLATTFTRVQFWGILTAAMSCGLAMSLIAVWRNWDGAVSEEERYWIGVYFNRNSLAPVAAGALLGIVGIVSVLRERWSRRTISASIGLAAVAGVAVFVLWRTESRTSPLALAVAVGALLVWFVARSVTIHRIPRAVRDTAPVAVAVAAVVMFFALRTVGGLSTVSGETSTFNSRGALWSLSWTGFLEKPFHGWGWMAAWRTPLFFKQGTWWAVWDTDWSHNGYHDVLLGGGVLAMVSFAGMVWFGVRALGSSTSFGDVAPSFLLVCFVLAAATQESFFIGTHFLWALLIAGLFSPISSVSSGNND